MSCGIKPSVDAAPTSWLLRAAADDMAALEARIEELQTVIDQQAEAARAMYRRGYFAGHYAGASGRVCETAPERHARTKTRRALGLV